jgi:threonine dehydrogenase-like Zn-dependent dehydrogenase
MPRELICPALGKVAWREYQEPALREGEIRVRSQFGAEKHGTMLTYYKGHANTRGHLDSEMGIYLSGGVVWPYPLGLGNMTVGQCVEVGPGVTDQRVGDRILLHGPFRPTHVVRADKTWVLPEHVPWESAVCLDPAYFALGALRDGDARMGDVVVVFGMGALGLMTVRLAKAGGMVVYAVDPVSERRQHALRFGAAEAFSGTDQDVAVEIRRRTANRGADVVVDFSGALKAMQSAFRTVGYGGNIVSGAFPAPYAAGLDFGAEPHLYNVNIRFSRVCSEPNRDHPRWSERRLMDACFDSICQGVIDGRGIVNPIIDFELVDQAYPQIASGYGASIKLGVKFKP